MLKEEELNIRSLIQIREDNNMNLREVCGVGRIQRGSGMFC